MCNAIDAFDRQANHKATQGLSQAIAPPKIILKTQSDSTSLRLSISNNGPHIPTEDQKKIFDPFFTTQPIGQGTGLGCTISYQTIVEQHRGRISCQSVKGKLTRFTLELPLHQAPGNIRNAENPTILNTERL